MKDGVVFLAESAEREWDRAIAQLDVARLAHNVVGVRDDEVGESAMVFFEPFGALCVGLTGHLRAKIGELLAELFNLGLGLEMLESATDGCIGEPDGDGAESACVEFWVSLHDVERALGRKGVVVSKDTIDDFALFGLGVWGDGELRMHRSVSGFGGRCTRGSGGDGFRIGGIGRDGGWIHECDGGGTELRLGRDDFDAVAEDGGGGHVAVVWRCW